MQNDEMKNHATSSEQLKKYLEEKAENHNCYKLYSSLKRILEIKNDKCLYLGTGQKWNDVPDRKSFNSDHYDVVNFGKCFSFSQDESVAMWMLYGGINKCGGMVDFTNKGIKNILAIDKIELNLYKENLLIYKANLLRDSFEMFITDVIYYKEIPDNKNGTGHKKESKYYVRRSDENIKSLGKRVFQGLNGRIKAYPWQYENECRLIVSINKALIPSKYDSANVRIDLNNVDLGKSFDRIYHSPNYPFDDDNKKSTKDSKLNGSIDWNLCDDCDYYKKKK